MKILVTEDQFSKIKNLVKEQEDTYDEQCFMEEPQIMGDFIGLDIQEEDLGPEMTDDQLLNMVKPENKGILGKILNNLSQMSPDGLKNELDNLRKLKNLKEQQTPYMERNTTIAGVQVPTALVHGMLAIVGIAILSKLSRLLFTGSTRRRYTRRQRLRDRAVGCQGARARARLVAQRRRREGWRSFLRKLGLR